ncbi:Uncharacterised protein [Vibrio cholerae]|nr:Uncharacterised protein [Vibrio cholerae]CSH83488.1 Uncharacterised protein [Vibrio cholerae]CSI65468.1 Uncharacterised protein [Vibrio cholerae]
MLRGRKVIFSFLGLNVEKGFRRFFDLVIKRVNDLEQN